MSWYSRFQNCLNMKSDQNIDLWNFFTQIINFLSVYIKKITKNSLKFAKMFTSPIHIFRFYQAVTKQFLQVADFVEFRIKRIFNVKAKKLTAKLPSKMQIVMQKSWSNCTDLWKALHDRHNDTDSLTHRTFTPSCWIQTFLDAYIYVSDPCLLSLTHKRYPVAGPHVIGIYSFSKHLYSSPGPRGTCLLFFPCALHPSN